MYSSNIVYIINSVCIIVYRLWRFFSRYSETDCEFYIALRKCYSFPKEQKTGR